MCSLPWLLLLLSFSLVLSGCPEPRERVECDSKADCSGNEVCDEFGECVEPDCEDDGDCGPEEFCDEGECTETCTEETCAEDEVCDDESGLCAEPCAVDADCDPDEACLSETGACYSAPCDLGPDGCPDGSVCDPVSEECRVVDCSQVSECPDPDTQQCLEGACRPPCRLRGCPTRMVCTGGRCEFEFSLPFCGSQPELCGHGQVCANQFCQAACVQQGCPDAQACDAVTGCMDQLCETDDDCIDRSLQACVPAIGVCRVRCSEEDDCAIGSRCEPGLDVCRPDACDDLLPCESGAVCSAGFCLPECFDDPCAPGDECDRRSGLCQPAPPLFTDPRPRLELLDGVAGEESGLLMDVHFGEGDLQPWRARLRLDTNVEFLGFAPGGTPGQVVGVAAITVLNGRRQAMPILRLDAETAYVDLDQNGAYDPGIDAVFKHRLDERWHTFTLTVPKGGDGSSASNTLALSGRLQVSFERLLVPQFEGPLFYRFELEYVDRSSGGPPDAAYPPSPRIAVEGELAARSEPPTPGCGDPFAPPDEAVTWETRNREVNHRDGPFSLRGKGDGRYPEVDPTVPQPVVVETEEVIEAWWGFGPECPDIHLHSDPERKEPVLLGHRDPAYFACGHGCVLFRDADGAVVGGAGSCDDGRRTGDETDVDCGGFGCGSCPLGQRCLIDRDCTGGSCFAGVCSDGPVCSLFLERPAGGEVLEAGGLVSASWQSENASGDVELSLQDQGGAATPLLLTANDGSEDVLLPESLEPGRYQLLLSDVANASCVAQTGLLSVTPPRASCDDELQNQDESDTDCGGSCTACEAGQACGSDADCRNGPCRDRICTQAEGPHIVLIKSLVDPETFEDIEPPAAGFKRGDTVHIKIIARNVGTETARGLGPLNDVFSSRSGARVAWSDLVNGRQLAPADWSCNFIGNKNAIFSTCFAKNPPRDLPPLNQITFVFAFEIADELATLEQNEVCDLAGIEWKPEGRAVSNKLCLPVERPDGSFLEVTKTLVDPGTGKPIEPPKEGYRPGDEVFFRVIAQNTGNRTARNVTELDDSSFTRDAQGNVVANFDAFAAISAPRGPRWECPRFDDLVRCQPKGGPIDLAPGATLPFLFRFRISSQLASRDLTQICNGVEVYWEQERIARAAPACVPVQVPTTRVVMTKEQIDPETSQPTSAALKRAKEVTYRVRIENEGPGDALDVHGFEDASFALDRQGNAVDNFSDARWQAPEGWRCFFRSGRLSCEPRSAPYTLPAEKSLEFVLTFRVADELADPALAELCNKVFVKYREPFVAGEQLVQAERCDLILPPEPGQIELEKEVEGEDVRVGDEVVFRVTATNPGDSPARGVILLEDSFGEGFSFREMVSKPDGWSCGGVLNGFLCRSQGVSLAPRDSLLFAYRVGVLKEGEVCNVAKLTWQDGPSQAESCLTAGPRREPRIEISKVADVAGARVGDRVRFLVTIQNTGDAPAERIQAFTDSSAGFAFVRMVGGTPAGWQCGSPTATILTCFRDEPLDLAPGQGFQFEYDVVLSRAGAELGQSCNTASLIWRNGPSEAELCIPALPGSALSVTKQADPGRVTVGELVRFTVTVTNTGQTPIRNVRALDDSTSGGFRVERILKSPPNWRCNNPGSGLLVCFHPRGIDLQPKQSLVFRYLARAEEAAGERGEGCNFATITWAEGPTDARLCLPVDPAPQPRLEITKIPDRQSVRVGDRVTYFVSVENTGEGTARRVSAVLDTLLVGLRVERSLLSPPGWKYEKRGDPFVTYRPRNGPVDLPPGGVLQFEYSTIVIGEAAERGEVCNSVDVNWEKGPTREDVCIPVLPGTPQDFPLALSKEADVASAGEGEPVDFTVTIVNRGETPVRNLFRIDDNMTGNFRFDRVILEPLRFDCSSPSEGLVACFAPGGVELAPGESLRLVYRARVSDNRNFEQAACNYVTVQWENGPSEVGTCIEVPPAPAPRVVVRKRPDRREADLASRVDFTVEVTNEGSAPARLSSLEDEMVLGFEQPVVTAVEPGWSCVPTSASKLECTPTTPSVLEPGETLRFAYWAEVGTEGARRGDACNVATVRYDEGTATSESCVRVEPPLPTELQVETEYRSAPSDGSERRGRSTPIDAAAGIPAPGDEIGLLVRVTNVGDAVARDIRQLLDVSTSLNAAGKLRRNADAQRLVLGPEGWECEFVKKLGRIACAPSGRVDLQPGESLVFDFGFRIARRLASPDLEQICSEIQVLWEQGPSSDALCFPIGQDFPRVELSKQPFDLGTGEALDPGSVTLLAGQELGYRIRIENTGTAPAERLSRLDDRARFLDFASGQQRVTFDAVEVVSQPPGWRCAFKANKGRLRCKPQRGPVDLAPDDELVFEIRARGSAALADADVGEVCNRAELRWSNGPTSGQVCVATRPLRPQLEIVRTLVDPESLVVLDSPPAAGQAIGVRVEIANKGDGPARELRLVDDRLGLREGEDGLLPAAVAEGPASTPPGWRCDVLRDGVRSLCFPPGESVDLEAGGSLAFVLRARLTDPIDTSKELCGVASVAWPQGPTRAETCREVR